MVRVSRAWRHTSTRTYLSASRGIYLRNTGRLNKKCNLNLGRVSPFDRPLGGRAESDGFDPGGLIPGTAVFYLNFSSAGKGPILAG